MSRPVTAPASTVDGRKKNGAVETVEGSRIDLSFAQKKPMMC